MFKLPKIETYYGGKSGSGTYQTIINQLPPHKIYIEPFLGMGAIMRYKRLAEINIGCDLDKHLVYSVWQPCLFAQCIDVIVHCKCGMDLLEDISSNAIFTDIGRGVMVYLDPPYLLSSRKSDRPVYKYEFTDKQHIRLLEIVKKLPFNIALSSYNNSLYSNALEGWRKIEFKSQTRHGSATEVLFMNYPEPEALHDYSYLGNDFRERERIRRKILRHVHGLKRLPTHERQAILNALTLKL